jgi:hypothetical protein
MDKTPAKSIAMNPSKAATGKTTGTRKKTITAEERHHMISTAAYYCAEQRDFIGGNEMADWLAGEAKIDAMARA